VYAIVLTRSNKLICLKMNAIKVLIDKRIMAIVYIINGLIKYLNTNRTNDVTLMLHQIDRMNT
jgi:hypothetical protein